MPLWQVPTPPPSDYTDPNAPVRPATGPMCSTDNGDGMSPADWGSGSATPRDQTGDSYLDRMWAPDPPAYDPGPSLFELSQTKQRSPSLPEILNKGKYFGAVELLAFEPHFLGSTALTETTGTTVVARPFDFDFTYSPRLTVGFESLEGPGMELRYWNFNNRSPAIDFQSDGVTSGEAAVYLLGPERWTRISATGAGQQLDIVHELKVQSFDVRFFKDLKFKRARLNGVLGLNYATIDHRYRATLGDAGNNVLGTLLADSEFEGFGPTIGINYIRPIGHTKLELLGGVQITMLFGDRDQFVNNTSTLDFSRFNADELVTTLDSHLGVQYMHRISERRSIFARTTLETQHWIGGGTAIDPIGDFGVFGLTFGVGVNR